MMGVEDGLLRMACLAPQSGAANPWVWVHDDMAGCLVVCGVIMW